MNNNKVRPKSKSSSLGIFNFSFFGCNRPKQETEKRRGSNFNGLQHPSNSMLSPLGPNPNSISTQSDLNSNSSLGHLQNTLSSNPPIGEVFILGQKEKIIAKIIVRKISEAHFSSPSLLSSVLGMFGSPTENPMTIDSSYHHDRSSILKSSIATSKHQGSQIEKVLHLEEQHDMTPENVARHIAHRLKCDVIIDAICGYGEVSLQFAKLCNFVISIGAEPQKNSSAISHFKSSKFNHRIDFISGDITKLKGLGGDAIFINTTSTYVFGRANTENFSIFKHIKPDLMNVITKSIGISSKIGLKLPGYANLDEIAILFNNAITKHGLHPKRFCIEIEQILNSSEQLEHMLVFFGDCTSIDQKEEFEAVYNYLCRNESFECKAHYTYPVMAAIFERVGISRTLTYISKIKENLKLAENSKSPILINYLEMIVQENILTMNDLTELVEVEHKRRSSSLFNISDSFISSFTYHDRNITCFKNLNNKADVDQESFMQLANESQTKHKNKADRTSGRYSIEDSFWKLNSLASQYPNLHGELPEKPATKKALNDVSDLAVSSYSVASDYLDEDQESEEALSGTRSRSDTKIFQLEGLPDDRKLSIKEFGKIELNNSIKKNNDILDV